MVVKNIIKAKAPAKPLINKIFLLLPNRGILFSLSVTPDMKNETIDLKRMISIAGMLGRYLTSTFITAKMNVANIMKSIPLESMRKDAL